MTASHTSKKENAAPTGIEGGADINGSQGGKSEDRYYSTGGESASLSALGQKALEYAEGGWKVFPLAPGSKEPPKGGKGHLIASSDPETVRQWWEQTPNANIGLHLAASGLVAVDPDTYKPTCEWYSFIKGREIPATLEQSTPRGGRHYIFRAPEGAGYPGTLCREVDIKHNGYILLEPSVVDGKQYRFETDDDPAPCPDWVPLKGAKQRGDKAGGESKAGAATANGSEVAMVIAALKQAENALEREDWVKLCLAVKGTCGSKARGAFLEFSYRYEDATPGEPERLWNSANPDGRLSVGTIFHLLGTGQADLTEDGAARVFTDRFGSDLRYDHDAGKWFGWDGEKGRWQVDAKQLAFTWCRVIARELSEDIEGKTRAQVRKRSFASGVEAFCRADPVHAVTQDQWDRDPFLLGVPGGAVDLRSGEVRPPDPNAFITKQAGAAPSAAEDCPQWLDFLEQATGGDHDMIRFLQTWCGYCLTGDTREHALIFLYGPGGNGKSVFLNTLAGILGEYAVTAPMDAFTASKNDRHSTELAMMRGARMVSASETEEGRAWAESRIKSLTGGDKITARFMRQYNFSFLPQFKLTIVGNHKPVLHNVDDAMKRRFNIVPFVIKPEKPDRQLEAKLQAEWPGILRWMINGCLAWQAEGLQQPRSVADATAEYFSEQDLAAQWLEDQCIVEPDNEFRWETSADLFRSWSEYAKAAGEAPGTQKGLAGKLIRHGLRRKDKKFSGKTHKVWLGVNLVKPDPTQHGGRNLATRLLRQPLGTGDVMAKVAGHRWSPMFPLIGPTRARVYRLICGHRQLSATGNLHNAGSNSLQRIGKCSIFIPMTAVLYIWSQCPKFPRAWGGAVGRFPFALCGGAG